MSSYTVQSGDNLSRIAAQFGTSVSALVSANGIADPNRITVGQVLRIPATVDQSGNPVVDTSDDMGYSPPAIVSPNIVLPTVTVAGSGTFDLSAWFKPPKLYYVLAAGALAAFMFSKRDRRE